MTITLSEERLKLRLKALVEFHRCLGTKSAWMLILGLGTDLRARGCPLEQLPRDPRDLKPIEGVAIAGTADELSEYLKTTATDETVKLILKHLACIKTHKVRAA